MGDTPRSAEGSSSGKSTSNVAGAVTTTAPSAGAAAALPATPAGYVAVTINGVARKIAYY